MTVEEIEDWREHVLAKLAAAVKLIEPQPAQFDKQGEWYEWGSRANGRVCLRWIGHKFLVIYDDFIGNRVNWGISSDYCQTSDIDVARAATEVFLKKLANNRVIEKGPPLLEAPSLQIGEKE